MWEFWRTDKAKGKTRHRNRSASYEGSSPRESSTSGTPRAGTPRLHDIAEQDSSAVVQFQDAILPASDEEEGSISEVDGRTLSLHVNKSNQQQQRAATRQKLIILLVGLPARGKTYLANKIMCYMNWLGHETRHFNIGQYRRAQSHGTHESHTAAFFDTDNAEGRRARADALEAALADMESWLEREEAQIAICDATNSTQERRDLLRARLHGQWKYIFIESIITDQLVLEQNYRYKMMYSPDYRNQDPDKALEDFRERIRKYDRQYEPITDRRQHYIKLTDMVTGNGHMDINRISGYIPGKIVSFLLQVCRARGQPRRVWLTRHGESEYNVKGKLGGDSALSPNGQTYARMLPDVIIERTPEGTDGLPVPVVVWTSTLQRTIQTAERLPFPKLRWKVLDEIQAGIFDGWTYAEIQEKRPEEFAARKQDKLSYRYPSGESYRDVIARLDTVVTELERGRDCVLVVAHQAILRALYGYFTDMPLADIPSVEIPLHTLIELTPQPDGKMSEQHITFDLKNNRHHEPIRYQRVTSRQLPIRSSMDQLDTQPMRSVINQSPSLQLKDSFPHVHLGNVSTGRADQDIPQRPLSRRSPSAFSSSPDLASLGSGNTS